ncbi:ATP-binding cassette domain-containing protein [Candidatus Poribacteria bacterium]|nr:ATP-binding cassette domain-containing protein [Candidatus Poribacteria bacterium]
MSEKRVTVKAEGVIKEYRMGGTVLQALKGVDVSIEKGEYISIMGPSGSGKSTLFNMIGALDEPTSGVVYIDDVNLLELSPAEIAWIRCWKIGYIFQSFNLLPVMSALENVTLPMIFAGVPVSERRDKAMELLTKVGLGERADHKPTELSGGQQQRVAIARALANGPAIILADEPTGNLDLKTGRDIINLLKEMNEEEDVTIISATHDLKMLDVSDRVVYIRDGMVEQIKNRAELEIEIGSVEGEESGHL